MRIGSLIQWRLPYDDGLGIIKDAGMGIIVKIKEHVYEGGTLNGPGKELRYTVFDVYRNKFNDIITLSEDYISLKE
mgnify:FL=1|jgi:hypothetical protein